MCYDTKVAYSLHTNVLIYQGANIIIFPTKLKFHKNDLFYRHKKKIISYYVGILNIKQYFCGYQTTKTAPPEEI
jgi:hypothetical protein